MSWQKRVYLSSASAAATRCSASIDKTWDGVQLDFIGAINVHTIGAKERMIGNFLFECLPESGGSTVVGFENHSGKTYLAVACRRSARWLARADGNEWEDGL